MSEQIFKDVIKVKKIPDYKLEKINNHNRKILAKLRQQNLTMSPKKIRENGFNSNLQLNLSNNEGENVISLKNLMESREPSQSFLPFLNQK